MGSIHKKFTAEEKAKVALESLKGDLTSLQITAKYGVHATQIGQWRQKLNNGIVQIFRDKAQKGELEKDTLIDELYKQIGQLKVELDWVKKKSTLFN